MRWTFMESKFRLLVANESVSCSSENVSRLKPEDFCVSLKVVACPLWCYYIIISWSLVGWMCKVLLRFSEAMLISDATKTKRLACLAGTLVPNLPNNDQYSHVQHKLGIYPLRVKYFIYINISYIFIYLYISYIPL